MHIQIDRGRRTYLPQDGLEIFRILEVGDCGQADCGIDQSKNGPTIERSKVAADRSCGFEHSRLLFGQQLQAASEKLLNGNLCPLATRLLQCFLGGVSLITKVDQGGKSVLKHVIGGFP